MNGFDLNGSIFNSGFLLENNRAVNNGNAGFSFSNTSFDSRYLSNYAKNNTLNYSGLQGNIQIFSLDNSGNYTNVSGDAVHFSSLTNIDAL